MKRRTQTSAIVLTAFVYLATGLVSDVNAGIIGGPIQNPANGHIYYLLDRPDVGWNYSGFLASEAEANALGGHLATINDQAENDWIHSTFGPMLPGGEGIIGIGLNDFLVEGDYVWTSGETPGYFNWDPNQNGHLAPQPDGALDDVVGMVVGFWTSGTWHDFYTDGDLLPPIKPFRLVEVVPVPEPSTAIAMGVLGVVGFVRNHRRKSPDVCLHSNNYDKWASS